MKSNRFATIIRWVARITGTLILIFILFFVIMHFFGSEEGEGLISSKDAIAFICFPAATVVGLALAFKWEGLGGLISTLGFIGLFLIRPDLLFSPFMLSLSIPGLLYLIYWVIVKKLNRS